MIYDIVSINIHREGVKVMSVCPWGANTGMMRNVISNLPAPHNEIMSMAVVGENEDPFKWFKDSIKNEASLAWVKKIPKLIQVIHGHPFSTKY